MLKTFSLRDARVAAHGLRAARAARPVRRARARLRQAHLPARARRGRAGEALERDGYELLRLSASRTACRRSATRSSRRSGRAGSTSRRPTRSACRSGPSAARSSAASRSRSPTAASSRPSEVRRPAAARGARSSTPATRRRPRRSSVLLPRAPTCSSTRRRSPRRSASAAADTRPLDRAPGGRGRARRRRVAARADARLAALLRPRAAARGARGLPGARSSRATSTSIEVPFPERGEPALVKGGARPERTREETPADVSPDAGFDRRAARYEELRPVDENWWEVYERARAARRPSRQPRARGRLRHRPARRRPSRSGRSPACGRSTPPTRWSSARRRSASTPASRAPRRCRSRRGWFDAVVMRMVAAPCRPPARARGGRPRPLAGRPARDRDRGSGELRRRLVRAFVPVRARARRRRFPSEPALRAELARGGPRPRCEIERLRQHRTILASAALDVIRSKAFSTFDLLPPASTTAGLARPRPSSPRSSTTASTGCSPARRPLRLAGYPREWLLLALVALATLPLVSATGAQDSSRLALTDSIVLRGAVDIDPYWRLTIDRAFAGGTGTPTRRPACRCSRCLLSRWCKAADGGSDPIWLRTWALSNLGEVPFQPPSVPFGIARSHALVLFRITRLNRLTILPNFSSPLFSSKIEIEGSRCRVLP